MVQLNFLSKLVVRKKRLSVSRCADQREDLVLKSIWLRVRAEYFPDRLDLDAYTVRWSRRRQRRVLASVSITRKFVCVAKELASEAHYCWLEPLLYHEMCHAVLGENVVIKKRKRQWHGTEFKLLERNHPASSSLDLWIKTGGWSRAVQSSRARETWQRRAARCGNRVR